MSRISADWVRPFSGELGMIHVKHKLGLAVLCTGSLLPSLQAADAAGLEFFEKKIRPVLVEHCYKCHSAESLEANKLKGGLRLDTQGGTRAGGDTGPAVVPGKVSESLLISALRQERFEMPPKGKLPDAVIADFVKWIEMGAPDPRTKEVAAHPKPAITAGDHWAFKPAVAAKLPNVKRTAWLKGDLDRFVLARMEEKELQPVSAASDRELARRIYFDLTGLPPSPEQMAQFITAAKKDRAKAVGALVDTLLTSPRYGERWGRHWLDVARYAEDQAHTFGVRRREHAHQYRDWVIRAINEDLPFDQFVKLQIAGDLMEDASGDRFRQMAGMGFLGLGAQYYKNSDRAKAEADELDDAIDTLTRGFLGLTVSCARCHDHKYDPVPTIDYYSLAGIFNGRGYREAPLVTDEVVKTYNEGQQRVKEQEKVVREFLLAIARRNGEERFGKIGQYMLTAWRLNALSAKGIGMSDDDAAKREKLHPYFVKRFREYFKPGNKNEAVKRLPVLAPWFEQDPAKAVAAIAKEELKYETVPVPKPIADLAAEMQKLALAAQQADRQLTEDFEKAQAVAETKQDKKKVRRGKLDGEHDRVLKQIWLDGRAPLYAKEGEAEKHFLADSERAKLTKHRDELENIKKTVPAKFPVAHVISGGGRTMQVYVRGNPANRGTWAAKGFLQIFSEGERPTEQKAAQELKYTRLDLAKAIASPDNPLTARVIVNRVWQWHFGRGLVGSSSNFGLAGSKPSHPALLDWLTVQFIKNGWSLKWLHRQIISSATYQSSSDQHVANANMDADNRFLWRFNRRRLDVESWRDALLSVSGQLDLQMGGPTVSLGDAKNRRRTVYAKISRHELDGLLRLFDFPDANVSAAKRTETTVPQQQLFVLNSPFFVDQARGFANRLREETTEDAARVQRAYQLAFGREPSAEELQLGLAFAGGDLPAEGDKVSRWEQRWEQYCQALLATNEFLFVD
jgi:hypothetical protein